ncbi:MAG TPA: uracil phosphoribosyltransferase [Verrucomicrobiae bacterium]|nr:uracil phosphoribosyltransferase [Verrucomicrobiae bacterium]
MRDTVHVLSHPLALSFLTDIRDKNSDRAIVRSRIRALSVLLFYEATHDLPQEPMKVTTPLAETTGAHVGARVGLVPVLRAGLGMVDGILEFLPEAHVFHLGLFRDEKTLEPVEYYSRFSQHQPVDIAFVLDPMLATGGSACVAVARLKKWGVKKIKYLGLFAAPEGIEKLSKAHHDVEIYLGTVDAHLNDRGYIVPGMGDAGDRQFSGE